MTTRILQECRYQPRGGDACPPRMEYRRISGVDAGQPLRLGSGDAPIIAAAARQAIAAGPATGIAGNGECAVDLSAAIESVALQLREPGSCEAQTMSAHPRQWIELGRQVRAQHAQRQCRRTRIARLGDEIDIVTRPRECCRCGGTGEAGADHSHARIRHQAEASCWP